MTSTDSQANSNSPTSNASNANVPFFQIANADKIAYLEGIVGKQLDLYNWCEEKVSTLATIDSILIAVATLLIDKVTFFDIATCKHAKLANAVVLSILLLPLFLSMGITLWHIRPKMGNASNTGTPNHRSSNGIRHFQNKAAYRDRLSTISAEEICNELSNQIYGMNGHIWTNQLSIKTAVVLDIISLVGFFVVAIGSKLL